MDEVLDAVENSPTSGRDTAVDAPLADGLPSHTGVGVDVLHGGGGGARGEGGGARGGGGGARGGGMSGADVEERRNFALWSSSRGKRCVFGLFFKCTDMTIVHSH